MSSNQSDHDLLIRIDANIEGMKKWMVTHETKDDSNFTNVMAKVNSLYNWRAWTLGGIAAFGFVITIVVTLHK